MPYTRRSAGAPGPSTAYTRGKKVACSSAGATGRRRPRIRRRGRRPIWWHLLPGPSAGTRRQRSVVGAPGASGRWRRAPTRMERRVAARLAASPAR